ncbi:SUMF1/EgtB/PvdO family nonheme iron enzyme [Oceaniglobus trochenteri]|uniref:SUMF1/EgtB/PvdO family nonheme iron enzyme n=1 Tax=Oceaniglobus trochenteri TaxID=2763260 RepID=UPI001CFFC293|nr:SUMF1/EgtB/PvdO family nonheme iron enzyme [Oceaniglobus trochenteri]
MQRRRSLIALALGATAIAGLALWLQPPAQPRRAPPQTTPVAAGEITFRPIGSFQQGGKTVTPPTRKVAVRAFDIMTYQVTGQDYDACVQAGACVAPGVKVAGSLPQTHVNWKDASAYAAWLSRETGTTWRLPSAEEWQLAAAERFGDAAPAEDLRDPGQRMLEQYERGILLRGRVSYGLRPAGGFGTNSQGVADMAGNVWEWTDGCIENGTLAHNGRVNSSEPYCGVRIAGGLHPAAVIDFVRDAGVGGCAVGLPPDFLGFRLVRGG